MTQVQAAPTVTTINFPELHDAALDYLAIDVAKTGAWDKVARFVHNNFAKVNMEEAFDTVEEEAKKLYGVDSMPSAWRSAKSTALSAAANGIVLVDTNGAVAPKTQVATALRTLSTVTTVAVSPLDKCIEHLDQVHIHGMAHTLSAADLHTLGSRLEILRNNCLTGLYGVPF